MEERAAEHHPEREPPRADDSAPVELAVGGMHCPSCVARIEETLIRTPGVHKLTVGLDSARAAVTFDRSKLSVDDLGAVVVRVGYSSTPMASDHPVS